MGEEDRPGPDPGEHLGHAILYGLMVDEVLDAPIPEHGSVSVGISEDTDDIVGVALRRAEQLRARNARTYERGLAFLDFDLHLLDGEELELTVIEGVVADAVPGASTRATRLGTATAFTPTRKNVAFAPTRFRRSSTLGV